MHLELHAMVFNKEGVSHTFLSTVGEPELSVHELPFNAS